MENKKLYETNYQFYHYGEDLVDTVLALLGPDFGPIYNKSGVTIYGGVNRILKLVNAVNYLKIEFNVPVTRVDGLTVLTKEEAKAKTMGTCQWIYKGESLDTAMNLVKEAKEKFILKHSI